MKTTDPSEGLSLEAGHNAITNTDRLGVLRFFSNLLH